MLNYPCLNKGVHRLDKKDLRAIPVREASADETQMPDMVPSARYLIDVSPAPDGEDMIILSIYKANDLTEGITTPVLRVFQKRDEYITQRFDKSGWLTGRMQFLLRYCPWSGIALINHSSIDTLNMFLHCQDSGEHPLIGFEHLQQSIVDARREKREIEIKRGIDERMALVPGIPAELTNWIDRTLLAQRYIFYTYHRAKTQEGLCTHCGQTVCLENPRHGKTGVCPSCGHTVAYKAVVKAGGRVTDSKGCCVVQSVDGGCVIRYFTAYRRMENPANPSITTQEYGRVFGWKDDTINAYEWGKFLGHGSIGWTPLVSEDEHYFTGKMAFPCDVKAAMGETPFARIVPDDFTGAFEEFPFHAVMRFYKKNPTIEYLIKMRLRSLTMDVIFGNVSGVNLDGIDAWEVLRLDGQRLRLLRKLDGNKRILEILQTAFEARIQLGEQDIGMLQEKYGYNAQDIVRAMPCATLERIDKYLQKQGGKHFWYDYIRNCRVLGYDLKNDFVLFPKNLRNAHDLAAIRKSLEGSKIYEERCQIVFTEYQNLQWARDGMLIVVPSTAKEIVQEGHALHHCVGIYLDRIASGETKILFLRKEDQPQKPFFTVEIRMGTVVQCRGRNNCAPPPEVSQYIEQYKKTVLSRKQGRKAG